MSDETLIDPLGIETYICASPPGPHLKDPVLVSRWYFMDKCRAKVHDHHSIVSQSTRFVTFVTPSNSLQMQHNTASVTSMRQRTHCILEQRGKSLVISHQNVRKQSTPPDILVTQRQQIHTRSLEISLMDVLRKSHSSLTTPHLACHQNHLPHTDNDPTHTS